MWARLQGVGISVRVDTALPWPPPLLHKTSQPALSPGLESVSAATCQIKTERKTNKQTLSLPSSSLCHQPSFSPSLLLFLCLIADELCLWEDPSHEIRFEAACLSYKLRLPFCYLFSSRATHHQSNLVLIFHIILLRNC